MPVSIKDLILTRGWPTLRGSRTVDPQQPWDVDAPVTARLREAGAVLLGKTSDARVRLQGRDQLAAAPASRATPGTRRKTPGGSSGGAAAAVAAGMGPLAVGTDGAGSVRIPAAFCGNFGLKPSFGRVPAYPLSPFGTVAHLGPHTMSVRDAALMMNVIKQPDARDWTSLPPDGSDYRSAWTTACAACASPTRRRWAMRRTCTPRSPPRSTPRCANSQRWAPGSRRSTPASTTRWRSRTGLWFVGAWTLWNTLTPEQQARDRPRLPRRGELGASFSALDVQRLNLRRGALGSHMRQFMQRFDLLVTPALAVPAFDALPAGHAAHGRRRRCSAGRRSPIRST